MKEIKARPSAISTNALGSIATLFSTMATFLILLLSPNISDQADRSVNNVILIPLEIIHSNLDLRKALKAHLIDKAMTLEPHGINRLDEFN